jgi:hypothetical protein
LSVGRLERLPEQDVLRDGIVVYGAALAELRAA